LKASRPIKRKIMTNPKAQYHSFAQFAGAAPADGVTRAATQFLNEGMAFGAGGAAYASVPKQNQLEALSITTIEEAVGAARAVPEAASKILGPETVALFRSDSFINEASFRFPALRRFRDLEKRKLSFGARLSKPRAQVETGISFDDQVPPPPRAAIGAGNAFSMSSNPCMPPIRDQGDRWTCVAFATCALMEYAYCVAGKPGLDFSEQFHYWDTKCNDPDGYLTLGTYPDISFSRITIAGVCKEPTWLYDMVSDPPQNAPEGPAGRPEAAGFRVPTSVSINNYRDVPTLKNYLTNGSLIAIAIPVYSWATNPATHDTGNIGMPLPGETSNAGHAIVLVGYADDPAYPGGGYFILRNSYGTQWGSQCPYGAGYGTIPYQYISLYNYSAFVIRL